MKYLYAYKNRQYWINQTPEDFYISLNTLFKFEKIMCELLEQKLGEGCREIPIEAIDDCVEEAIERTLYEVEKCAIKFQYSSDEDRKHTEEVREMLVNDLREHVYYYMVNRNRNLYSRTERSKEIVKELEELEEKVANMTKVEKFALNFSLSKTAPTLFGGYVVLICLLVFEGFFFKRLTLWVCTILMFIAWRKKQIEIYNGKRK